MLAERLRASKGSITLGSQPHTCTEMKSMQLFFQHLVKMAASRSRTCMFAYHDNDVAEHGGNSPNSMSIETYSLVFQRTSLIWNIYIVIVIYWPFVISGLQLIEVSCFWSWPLLGYWLSIVSQAQTQLTYFTKPGSPLLRLVKSRY